MEIYREKKKNWKSKNPKKDKEKGPGQWNQPSTCCPQNLPPPLLLTSSRDRPALWMAPPLCQKRLRAELVFTGHPGGDTGEGEGAAQPEGAGTQRVTGDVAFFPEKTPSPWRWDFLRPLKTRSSSHGQIGTTHRKPANASSQTLPPKTVTRMVYPHGERQKHHPAPVRSSPGTGKRLLRSAWELLTAESSWPVRISKEAGGDLGLGPCMSVTACV